MTVKELFEAALPPDARKAFSFPSQMVSGPTLRLGVRGAASNKFCYLPEKRSLSAH